VEEIAQSMRARMFEVAKDMITRRGARAAGQFADAPHEQSDVSSFFLLSPYVLDGGKKEWLDARSTVRIRSSLKLPRGAGASATAIPAIFPDPDAIDELVGE